MDSQPVRAEEILKEEAKKDSKYKSIEVFKEVEPIIDVGNLYLNDLQPVDVKEIRSDNETFLKNLARDNVQLLFNKIWELPIERVDNVIVCNLPSVTTVLPREKKIPKPKPPTKWEKFAKEKGIQNKKRGRMIFDEESSTWKPRFGYKRGNDDTKEWCVEVPENADPNEDQFEKRDTAKKERVAKNELQRLRNIGRNSKISADHKKAKEGVEKEIDLAKKSTASLGKFQEKLPKEKENKKKGIKRKFESVCGDRDAEKQKTLEIWGKMNKKPSLDITKGVNKHIANEQANAPFNERKKTGKVKNKRFKKGAQATADRKRQKIGKIGKGKTLGKRK